MTPTTTAHDGRIVVGVDPSRAGRAALEWALRDAVSTGASVQAIRAWTASAAAMDAYANVATDGELPEVDQAQLEADEQLKLACERVAGTDTIDCTATAVLGAASQVLVEQAQHSAMVVVGARSRGGFTGLLLGSPSTQLAQHAPCPVLVART